ncbi:2'-5' RNA ligase family protein [Lederbergia ruris]|uniref:2'-5' RNA ligase family protein n=1 Tax=Lederbergia ruris TaxID=217495 RepID=UPI00130E02D1
MYGLIALFDERTEQLIRDIWKELKERSISTYAYEVEDRRPHITLAIYNNIKNKTDFIKQMDVIYKNQLAIDIKFNAIGSFLKSGALFFSPTITEDLINFHSNHHKNFKRYNDDPNSLYLPDNWIPHCTIANRLSPEKLAEAFRYCSQRNSTIFGKIVELALIDGSDKSKAPIIYSKELSK